MSRQHQTATGDDAFENVFERAARADRMPADTGMAPTPENAASGPQSQTSGLSVLKAARLKRKLVKMLGLKRDAAQTEVLASVRRLVAASRAVQPAQPGTTILLGLRSEAQLTTAELLQMLAGLQAVPRGLAEEALIEALPLSEPLQALRDAAGQRGPGSAR